MFDLDNPEKPIEIPTRSGWMHKANVSDEEEQFEDVTSEPIEQPPTETEQKALHFFEAGHSIDDFLFKEQRICSLLGESTGAIFYLKTAFAWICGLERTDELDHSSIRSNSISQRRSIVSLREGTTSSWHRQCSYAAIVLLALCAFVWAFFTDYRIRLN